MATYFVPTRIARSRKPLRRKRSPLQIMKPVILDSALAAFMKKKSAPRSQITKAVWVYAKKAKLQRGATIVNSGELKPLFGKKGLIKFGEIAGMINNHTAS